MKFLLDANIALPLEPTTHGDVEPNTVVGAEFVRLAQTNKHDIFLHRALRFDVARDGDAARAATREVLFSKYRRLAELPPVAAEVAAAFGSPAEGTNDWVDMQHLAALTVDAVDYLVTEDLGLHRRARRLGLERRVLFLADALTVIRGLQPAEARPPPAVERTKVYALPVDDPFWNSLRADYLGFDAWLQRCRKEHRDALVIWGPSREIAGACLLKDEQGPEFGMEGHILKLATFKISDEHRGLRYGELLLRAALDAARAAHVDWIYVTAFARQGELIAMLSAFGFDEWAERKSNGELVLRKNMCPAAVDRHLPALEFNRRFGPHLLRVDGVSAFLVPIQPRFHGLLFPDAEPQLALSAGVHPFGNAIRKAYLCHAPTRLIEPGSILLFYRTENDRGVRAVGVAEETFVSNSAAAIARFVGTRTVYPLREIEAMCTKPVLAILFRHARRIDPGWNLTWLQREGFFDQPPQTIVRVPAGSLQRVATDWAGPAAPIA